jgi:hypothetical protein
MHAYDCPSTCIHDWLVFLVFLALVVGSPAVLCWLHGDFKKKVDSQQED